MLRGQRLSGVWLAIGLLICCATTLLWGQSEKPKKKEKLREIYSASAYSRSLGARGVTSVTIYIEGYSSDEEVLQLAETLRSKGSDALLNAVSKMKEKGRLAPMGRTGNSISVIRSRPTEKGRRITMVADRPIGFLELRSGTRSRDYPFGIIQLEVDAEGKGEGVMLAAAKIKFKEGKVIEFEHYGTEPVRLMNVRKEK